MFAATSSALAPDQVTVTVICFSSMVGKNWVLMRASETTPANSIRIISRLAAFG